MKKLLACLLALMLPFSALADNVLISAHTYLMPKGIMELLTQLDEDFTPGASYPKLEQWVDTLTGFVRKFYLRTVIEPDSGRALMTLRYNGEDLFSYDVVPGDEGAVALLSWMPDTPLLLARDSLLANPAAALRSVDWAAVGHTLDDVFGRWSDALESTEETGRFAGDAYEGGAYRVTVRFDDRDLALLLDMLLDSPWPESLTSLWGQAMLVLGEEPADMLAALRAIVRQAGLENRYRYVLRLVEDDRGEPIGLSLIAYLEDEQVATLSVGQSADSDTMTLALGWGLRNENDYLVIQTFDPQDKLGDCILSAALLRDPTRRQSLSTLSADPASAVMHANLFDESRDDTGSWRLSMSGEALANQTFDLAFTRFWDSPLRFYHSVSAKVNGQAILLFDFDTLRTEQTLDELDISDLEPIGPDSLSPSGKAALIWQLRAGLAELSVRLFKLMPPELLTLPMNPDFLSPE